MKPNLTGVSLANFLAKYASEVQTKKPEGGMVNIALTSIKLISLSRRKNIWYAKTSVGERKVKKHQGNLYFNSIAEKQADIPPFAVVIGKIAKV